VTGDDVILCDMILHDSYAAASNTGGGICLFRSTTPNTVIQCLTLNYDIDLEPTLVKQEQILP